MNKKIYVFAIGGSGARVLRSLVMLLAAGVEIDAEIVPIIIDPDNGAGNLEESVVLMKQYSSLRNQSLGVDKLVCFTTPLEPLPNNEFLVPLNDVAGKKFQDYIQLTAGMSEASSALVRSLFSREHLDLDMEVGFKGSPNIGSVVLGQFEESSVYQDFVADFTNGGGDKRIFIISSIFGGTGASGFPTLLKTLRSSPNIVADAHIGAVSLLPYFAVQNDPDSAIDSSTFYAKTRAALSYYVDNIVSNDNIDDLYYIGDDAAETYENHEGGAEQKNPASFVELVAALSLVDFAKRPVPNAGMPRKATMHEFGLGNVSSVFDLKGLGDKTQRMLSQPLAAMYLMRRYTEKYDLRTQDAVWLRDVQRAMDDRFVTSLEGFLECYEQWLCELKENAKRAFAPINLDQSEDKLFGCVSGYPVEESRWSVFAKKNFDLYIETLNTFAKKSTPQTMGEMLNMLANASYELCANKINLPS